MPAQKHIDISEAYTTVKQVSSGASRATLDVYMKKVPTLPRNPRAYLEVYVEVVTPGRDHDQNIILLRQRNRAGKETTRVSSTVSHGDGFFGTYKSGGRLSSSGARLWADLRSGDDVTFFVRVIYRVSGSCRLVDRFSEPVAGPFDV